MPCGSCTCLFLRHRSRLWTSSSPWIESARRQPSRLSGGRYFGFVDRRLAAGCACGELAGRRLGPECGAPRDVAGRGRARGRRARLARSTCSDCPHGLRRRRSSPARRWPTSPALAAARHALLARAGWDVERDGLFGAPPITVVVGDEVHVSVLKALGLLGLGRDRVLRVPVDGQGRMRADALPPLDDRTIVCIQAGNVNTGAFDPARDDLRRARDGRRVGARRRRVRAVGRRARRGIGRTCSRGFELADSWATDAPQVAQRAVRLRHRARARTAAPARGDGDVGRRTSCAGGAARPVALHARVLAPRARRRGLGGAALARPRRAGRSDRAHAAATRDASPTASATPATRS